MNTDQTSAPDDPGALRAIKASLTHEEFGAVRWAAAHTPHPLPDGRVGKSMPLADFFRAALFDKVRATVRGEIERGKPIPPNIAAMISGIKPGSPHPRP